MAIEKEKIFLSEAPQASDFLQKKVCLPVMCFMAKAHTHRTGIQGACGAVGQWRAVKPGTHSDPLPGQKIRRFLAVYLRHKRHHSGLMGAVKDLKAKFF